MTLYSYTDRSWRDCVLNDNLIVWKFIIVSNVFCFSSIPNLLFKWSIKELSRLKYGLDLKFWKSCHNRNPFVSTSKPKNKSSEISCHTFGIIQSDFDTREEYTNPNSLISNLPSDYILKRHEISCLLFLRIFYIS